MNFEKLHMTYSLLTLLPSSPSKNSWGNFTAESSVLDFWGGAGIWWSLNLSWIKLFSWFTTSFRSWFCCLMSLISSRINSNCLVISSEIFDPSSKLLIFLFTRSDKRISKTKKPWNCLEFTQMPFNILEDFLVLSL